VVAMELNVTQRIAKNTLVLLSSEAVIRALTFIITLLIARRLGAVSFGQYTFALAFVALFTVFADFGISTLIVRNVARERDLVAKYAGNFILLKLFLGLVVFCFVSLMIQFMGKGPEVKVLVYLAAMWLIIDSINMLIKAIFKAFEVMERVALIAIVEKAIYFGLCSWILLSSTFQRKLLLVVVAYPVSSVLALGLGLFLLGRITRLSLEIDIGFWRDMLREGWPFTAMGIFAATYLYLDKVILSMMKGDEVVGWYNAGCKLFLTIYAIQNFYYQALFPVGSRLFKESSEALKRLLDKTAKLILTYTVPLAAGGIILGPSLVRSLYGSEYISAIPVFQILLLNIVVKGINALYGGTVLLISDRQRDFMSAVGWGALTNVVLNMLLIPPLSLKGAAIATVCSETVVAVYSYLKAKEVLDIRMGRFVLKPVLSSSFMAFILCISSGRNIFFLIALGMISYFLLMFLFKGITVEDIAFVYNSFRIRKIG